MANSDKTVQARLGIATRKIIDMTNNNMLELLVKWGNVRKTFDGDSLFAVKKD